MTTSEVKQPRVCSSVARLSAISTELWIAELRARPPARPPRAKPPDYDRKLSRTLTLADSGKLRTLRDAANVLTGERFATVTKWAALEAAIELLMVAASDRHARRHQGRGRSA